MWLANRSIREESNRLVRLLHWLDCGIIGGALYLLAMFYGVPWRDDYSHLNVVALVAAFFVLLSSGLYRSWRGAAFFPEFTLILKSWIVIIGLVLCYVFITKTSYFYSRRVLLTWFVVTPAVIFCVHFCFRFFLRLARKRGYNIKTAIVAGAGPIGIQFARYLEEISWAGIRNEGFFDNDAPAGTVIRGKYRVLGTIEEIPDYVKRHGIDYIYIALPNQRHDQIFFVLNNARTSGAQLMMVPDLVSFNLFNAELQSLGDILVISFNPDTKFKRIFDVVFSIFVLLLFSPVFLVIALLIKCTGRGGVFYGQTRITFTGREFKCWKFRTMVEDAECKLTAILDRDPKAREEWRRNHKLKCDPRVTAIGRFLRKTSLDELPQFYNVIKGDMSVVGARPIVLEELQGKYREKAGLYCSVKPGITGLWQIDKRSDVEDYEERIRLDSEYILNRTIWLDLKIIFLTVWAVIKGKGAY